jgi:hypothetical protein
MDPKDNNESKIKSFLRRKDDIKLEEISTKTDISDNKQFIRQKLTENPPEPKMEIDYQELLKAGYRRYLRFFATFKTRQFKDNLPLALFLGFSLYILWKMEDQLDGMRRKVIVQKSIKEMEVEKENQVCYCL